MPPALTEQCEPKRCSPRNQSESAEYLVEQCNVSDDKNNDTGDDKNDDNNDDDNAETQTNQHAENKKNIQFFILQKFFHWMSDAIPNPGRIVEPAASNEWSA